MRVSFPRPSPNLLFEDRQRGYPAAAEALARQEADFHLGRVQPAAVLGSEVDAETSPQRATPDPSVCDDARLLAVNAPVVEYEVNDQQMRRGRVERDAWISSGAIVVIRGANLSSEAMAEALIAACKRDLDGFIGKRRPPMVLYVTTEGVVAVKEGGERKGGPKKHGDSAETAKKRPGK